MEANNLLNGFYFTSLAYLPSKNDDTNRVFIPRNIKRPNKFFDSI